MNRWSRVPVISQSSTALRRSGHTPSRAAATGPAFPWVSPTIGVSVMIIVSCVF